MTKSKFIAAVAALGALAIPASGEAAASQYTAPWQASHQGGDNFNRISGDVATGSAQVIRAQTGLPGGSLGCSGQGGFIEFEQRVTHTEPISEVTVSYQDAFATPYAFLKLSVRKDGEGVDARVVRGPLQGSGEITVGITDLAGNPTTIEGPLDIWFGVEVSGGCPPSTPPVDAARATFTTLSVS